MTIDPIIESNLDAKNLFIFIIIICSCLKNHLSNLQQGGKDDHNFLFMLTLTFTLIAGTQGLKIH